MKKNTQDTIQNILSPKTLRITALTSAGMISGIVTNIIENSSSSKTTSFLEELLNQLSNSNEITLNQDELTYVIENTKLYPISNLKEYVFLDRIELNSSKVIALCPLFEEAD